MNFLYQYKVRYLSKIFSACEIKYFNFNYLKSVFTALEKVQMFKNFHLEKSEEK